MLFSPETNCKIVRISALVCSFEHIRNWFLYKMFFHLAVQFSRYRMKCVSRLRFFAFAQLFRFLLSFRLAFRSAHLRFRFGSLPCCFPHSIFSSLELSLSIPENDTGSRRLTVIRPLCFCFVDFSPLRLLALSCSTNSLALVCIDLE